MIIDPPSLFSPLSEWVAFRKEMEALAKDDPSNEDVRHWIKEAEEAIARLK